MRTAEGSEPNDCNWLSVANEYLLVFATLAYGGFDFSSPDGDFGRTLGLLLVVVLLALICYVPSSVLAEVLKGPKRALASLVYIGIFLFIVPQLEVRGAYGPAHVAMSVGIWAFPALFVLLIAKILLVDQQQKKDHAPAETN